MRQPPDDRPPANQSKPGDERPLAPTRSQLAPETAGGRPRAVRLTTHDDCRVEKPRSRGSRGQSEVHDRATSTTVSCATHQQRQYRPTAYRRVRLPPRRRHRCCHQEVCGQPWEPSAALPPRIKPRASESVELGGVAMFAGTFGDAGRMSGKSLPKGPGPAAGDRGAGVEDRVCRSVPCRSRSSGKTRSRVQVRSPMIPIRRRSRRPGEVGIAPHAGARCNGRRAVARMCRCSGAERVRVGQRVVDRGGEAHAWAAARGGSGGTTKRPQARFCNSEPLAERGNRRASGAGVALADAVELPHVERYAKLGERAVEVRGSGRIAKPPNLAGCPPLSSAANSLQRRQRSGRGVVSEVNPGRC